MSTEPSSPRHATLPSWEGVGAFDAQAAALERAGRVDELVRLYEMQAREVALPSESADLLLKAAELTREKLNQPARTEGLLRQARQLGADVNAVLKSLRLLYEQRQDAASLADVLEQMATRATGAEAAALWLRAADLFEQKLAKRARAVICCQLASRADPRERQAFQRARKTLWAESRWVSVFESLERERRTRGGQDWWTSTSRSGSACSTSPSATSSSGKH